MSTTINQSESVSLRRGFFLNLNAHPMLAIGLALALLLVIVALAAPLLAPFDPDRQSLLSRMRPPIGFDRALWGHWLGTDELGRDILSRALYGLRLTLLLAFFSMLVSLVLGTSLGLVAGLLGGTVAAAIMSIVDVMLSLPFILVVLVVVALSGNNLFVLVLVLGMAYWAQFAQLVRAQVIALRDLPYVEAARSAGASRRRIALVHMIPNIISPVLVMATIAFSNLILLESSLSFLGLGVQPPTASLGSMVNQGKDFMASASWIAVVPALVIMLVSLIAMLLGDALRDRFDVRLRDR